MTYVVYDEVLKQEVEVQGDVTPEIGKELKIEEPYFKEVEQ